MMRSNVMLRSSLAAYNIALPKMGLDQYFFSNYSPIIFGSGRTLINQHFVLTSTSATNRADVPGGTSNKYPIFGNAPTLGVIFMAISNIIKFVLTAVIAISCNNVPEKNKLTYCGHKMSDQEYQQLKSKIELQKSPYTADVDHFYDQINDSVRSVMPDTVEFEIFLSLLNNNEVGIDIIVPRKEEYFQKISCAIMNSNFSAKMPKQKYVCLYRYTNPDGSGDSPLEIALKKMQ